MSRDVLILFAARIMRTFSYGMLSVALYLYLDMLFSSTQVGILLAAIMLGDLVITFVLTTTADVWGRRNTLLIGALLKFLGGVAFCTQTNYAILLLSGIICVISTNGGEIGPFLAVEQAALTQAIPHKDDITTMFTWYNLAGYGGQALGNLFAGWMIAALQAGHYLNYPYSTQNSLRAVLLCYAGIGMLMAALYLAVSSQVEAPQEVRETTRKQPWCGKFGLRHRESQSLVAKLSALFVIDSYAGGFVMQTLVVYWFIHKWGIAVDTVGQIMLATNLLAALSSLGSAFFVRRIGAINTMVFTHLPSNILLILVPLMHSPTAAVAMWLLRSSISQMDVPARQTYVVAMVAAEERSAAGGITNLVRSIGMSVAPMCVTPLLGKPAQSFYFSLPFIISGGLKILYDILVYASFQLQKKSASSPPPPAAQPDNEPHEETALLGNKSSSSSSASSASHGTFAVVDDAEGDDHEQKA